MADDLKASADRNTAWLLIASAESNARGALDILKQTDAPADVIRDLERTADELSDYFRRVEQANHDM